MNKAKVDDNVMQFLLEQCHFGNSKRFDTFNIDKVFWLMIENDELMHEAHLFDPLAQATKQYTFVLYPKISAYSDNGAILKVFNPYTEMNERLSVNFECKS